ncbi:hypothetical protein Mal64_17450 [Pseudobythopirellula maris]|uniref:Thioredoxin domain-containing protein n=1 Tax=Pseudobythopirellula maris TaxID=2527991 RepID=A0A5C5ZME0_9BACT|nr:hypothetical protein [Pseudobythopirellula maris]TWT88266.1 hypothetical protein Mal64_17450 [Pseudobythopirellula maris]
MTRLLLAAGLMAIALPGVAPNSAAAETPAVVLSEEHAAMAKVGVGDAMPPLSLATPGASGQMALADLYGEKATVVAVYSDDWWMSDTLLADLPGDVAEPFGQRGVNVAAVARGVAARPTKGFTTLVDSQGVTGDKLGEGRGPRVYVLDRTGKIVWFDIEYSPATRRELRQTLETLTADAG